MDLVIGNGLIGSCLGHKLRYHPDRATILTRKELDLTKDDWVLPGWSVFGERIAYICAGETSTVRCEEYPKETRLVNVTNTIKLAEKLIKKAKVIWLSSERVFDGSIPFKKVTDEPCPTTEYGRQKVETEKALLEMGCIVIRLSKVLGWEVPLFEGWVSALKKGEVIHPFSNMAMSPLPVDFVAESIIKVSKRDAGLYQMSGTRDILYSQIAYFIGAYIGADMKLIQPIEAASPHLNTTLDDNRLSYLLGLDVPEVWDTIYNWAIDNIGYLAIDEGR